VNKTVEYRYLSYELSEAVPAYGRKQDMKISQVKSLNSGDACNVYNFSMENHWGTHVDAPRHFFEKGPAVGELKPSYWVFERPQVIEVDLAPGELLTEEKWGKKVSAGTDLLLFRSGWGKKRASRPYCEENPGISPSVGYFLRGNFAEVRAVGIDWVSVSSFLKRDMGRETHRAFLDPDGKGNPIVMIEDMDLSSDMKGLARVIALPLRIENLDSAPCTVIGGFENA